MRTIAKLSSSTRQALAGHPSHPDLWLYEVWTPMLPNTLVPIDATISYKQVAIERHRSQLKVLDYRAAFLGLAAYRALFCTDSLRRGIPGRRGAPTGAARQ